MLSTPWAMDTPCNMGRYAHLYATAWEVSNCAGEIINTPRPSSAEQFAQHPRTTSVIITNPVPAPAGSMDYAGPFQHTEFERGRLRSTHSRRVTPGGLTPQGNTGFPALAGPCPPPCQEVVAVQRTLGGGLHGWHETNRAD